MDKMLDWRKVGETAQVDAAILRRALIDAELYPPEVIDDDDWQTWRGRCVLTMPEILEAVDTTDLLALFRVAQLLATEERDADVFRYGARKAAIDMARAGIDPRKFYDCEELGIQDRVAMLLGRVKR